MQFVAMAFGILLAPATALGIAIGKWNWPYCHIHVDRPLKAHSVMFFNSSESREEAPG